MNGHALEASSIVGRYKQVRKIRSQIRSLPACRFTGNSQRPRMRISPDRDQLFEEALTRIAELPPNEGLDVLLHFFLSVIDGMDLQAARQMRDELANRFGGRYCSSQVCRMMADLVNGHLAMRPVPAAQT